MSNSPGLERRYRRLLACYPRTFRREYEQEILSVLMAGAEEGQQWPRPREAADLIKRAVWMCLRPRAPRSQPTVFWAVVLMYVCAALRLLGVQTLPAIPGSTAHPLHMTISWGVFALLAWAAGRGHNWARVLFALWFGLHSLVLFYDIAHVSASAIPAGAVIASAVLWLVEFAAAVLILSKRSGAYYRHKPAEA
jgi:hypothetical protein